jgi:hypothetical protein
MSTTALATSFNGFLYVPDDPNKNLAGRNFFVQALILVPGFWESLRDEVLFPYSDYFLAVARKEVSEEGKQQAQRLFDRWLLARGIVDEWLMEAAQHTIQAWAMQLLHEGRTALEKGRLRPWYGPTEAALMPALQEFRPELNQAYPLPLKPLTAEEQRVLGASPVGLRIYQAGVAREPLRHFRKRMRKQFDAQLDAFVANLEARMMESRNMQRNAAWTALYQGGKSPKAIETWEWNRSQTAHSHARIQQAVHEFADAIGLTLRSPRGGPKVKGRRVSRAEAVGAI